MATTYNNLYLDLRTELRRAGDEGATQSARELVCAAAAKTREELVRILTEPNASITVQYKALMATEGVNIEFTEDGIKRIAQAAWQVNETTENIGARRLHTVLERLVEDISYDASEMNGQTVTIDAEYVSKHLDVLVADEDLSRFIL